MSLALLPDLTLAVLALLLTVTAWRRRCVPVAFALSIWTTTFALRVFVPLTPPIASPIAWLVLAVGLLATAFPALVGRFSHAIPSDWASPRRKPRQEVAVARLVAWSVLLTVGLAVGVWAFMRSITLAAGGSFQSLTPTEIRYAMNTQARGGGALGLLFTLAPVVAALGIVAWKEKPKILGLLVPLAVFAVLQSPARSGVADLAVMSVAFYAYKTRMGAHSTVRRGKQGTWRRLAVVGLVTAVAGILYFVHVGNALNKNVESQGTFPSFTGPSWLIQPILYLVGGVSALSVTIANGVDPYAGHHFSAFYAIVRAMHILFPSISPPDTIAAYVYMPVPSNVYTGFGQVYFDLWFPGVFVVFAALSAFVQYAHARAVDGDIRWAWLAAVGISMLVVIPLEIRALNLDIVFEAVVGWVALSHITRTPIVGARHAQVGSDLVRGFAGEPLPGARMSEVRAVFAHWKLVLSSAAITTAAVLLLSANATPTYSSSARVFVAAAQRSGSLAFQSSLFSVQRVASYAGLATSRQVTRAVIDRLGLALDSSALAHKVTATVVPNTVIVDITVTDASPKEAQRLADAVAAQATRVINTLEKPRGHRSPPITATVVDPASLPATPESPRPLQDVGYAIVLGLLLGIGGAVMRESLDRSIKGSADVAAVAAVPVLGSIPCGSSAVERPRVTSVDASAQRDEALRMLRANLRRVDADARTRVLTVTSPARGAGKTSIAVGLAITLAQAGQRILLLEGDLRRPELHSLLGLDQAPGLTTVLIGRTTLDDAVQASAVPNLSVLASGAVSPDSADLLQSQAMSDLLVDARTSSYDVVVIDAPPLLPATDAALLTAQSDGALLVVRQRKTSKEQLRHALERLEAVRGRPLGAVLTMLSERHAQREQAVRDQRYRSAGLFGSRTSQDKARKAASSR